MSLVSTSSGGLPWQLHPNPSGTSTTLRRPKLSTLCVLNSPLQYLSSPVRVQLRMLAVSQIHFHLLFSAGLERKVRLSVDGEREENGKLDVGYKNPVFLNPNPPLVVVVGVRDICSIHSQTRPQWDSSCVDSFYSLRADLYFPRRCLWYVFLEGKLNEVKGNTSESCRYIQSRLSPNSSVSGK